jgi:CHAD domain-containing protein
VTNLRHLVAVALLLGAAALSGCVKQPPPAARAEATPTPAAIDEGTDITAQHMRRKTAEAAAAIDNYLKVNEPRLHEKFAKFGDKFTRDKDVWRQKLLREKQSLQPQIDALKQKARDLDPKARAAIDQETAALEQQSRGADEKLSELESATADGWKEFKERLKAEDASKQDTPPTPVPSPTPR